MPFLSTQSDTLGTYGMKFDVKTWIVCAIPDCENRMILLWPVVV